MPFDVLPHHNIKFPEVQFYHPPWQLAQMMVEARQKMYDTALKGLDSVLNAVSPETMAKRREAILNAQIAQGKFNWMSAHNWEPYPANYRDMIDRRNYENGETMRQRREGFKGGGGDGTGTTTDGSGVNFTPAQNAMLTRTPTEEELHRDVQQPYPGAGIGIPSSESPVIPPPPSGQTTTTSGFDYTIPGDEAEQGTVSVGPPEEEPT